MNSDTNGILEQIRERLSDELTESSPWKTTEKAYMAGHQVAKKYAGKRDMGKEAERGEAMVRKTISKIVAKLGHVGPGQSVEQMADLEHQVKSLWYFLGMKDSS